MSARSGHPGRWLCAAFAVCVAAGCEPPAERFADLAPSFFAALNVFHEKTAADLPAFEARMERMAVTLQSQIDAGQVSDPSDMKDAGRALFYAGFLPLGVNQALFDGFASRDAVLSPRRYAQDGSESDELVARIRRAQQRLQTGAALRPDWPPAAAIRAGARYDLEEAQGTVTQPTLDAVVDAAQPDVFGTFSAVILTRNPDKHPLDAPHMQRLYALLCGPTRYACDRIGPPPPSDPRAERTLTASVAGPVILSDFLVRRVEQLVHAADASPATADAQLGEAMARVQMAAGALLNAQLNTQADDLSIYPASDTFDARQARIDALRDAVSARLSRKPAPALPEATQYYQSRTYRAAYQCAACHIPRPNLPDSFHGIPK